MLDRMSDTSRIIDKMVAKGLVERNSCSEDRRQVDLLISLKGIELLKKLDVVDKESIKIFENLNEKDLTTINDLLDKLRG
jgi:DNA-binding MarR family transcriptional regulator